MEISYRELMDMALRQDPKNLGKDNDWISLIQYAYERGRLEGKRNALEQGDNRYKEKLESVKEYIDQKMEEEHLHKTDSLFLPDFNVARTESLGECTWDCDVMMQ